MISTWGYLVGNVIRIYLCYMFMNVFYENRNKKKLIEISLYIVYYFVTSMMFLYMKSTILIIASNVIILLIIGLYYKFNIVYACLSMGNIYFGLILTEVFALFVLGNDYFVLGGEPVLTDVISYHILSQVFLFLYVIAVRRLKSINRIKEKMRIKESLDHNDHEKVGDKNNIYHIAVFIIPLVSTIIMMKILQISAINDFTKYLMFAMMLIVNITVFVLLARQSKDYADKVNQVILERQNQSYSKQVEYMESTKKRVMSVKHDVEGYLRNIKEYIKSGQYDEAEKFIDGITINTKIVRNIANSGNIVIDTALNYKLSQFNKDDAQIDILVDVPKSFDVITDIDLNSVLFNILDNAVNAIMKLDKEERKLKVNIHFDQSKLFINIVNSYNGQVKRDKNNKLLTTHSDIDSHGYGLKIIQSILGKYDGICDIETKGNMFDFTTIMYDC